MRRINAEIQGGKVQEYWRISSLSDAEVQYLDKQKIQDLVGGSIKHNALTVATAGKFVSHSHTFINVVK